MMNAYRQAGIARVYWLTLPTPRDPARQRIARVVNAAIEVAAEPWRTQVRVIDTVPTFTPGDRYRDSMTINGQPTIVRQSDGIHLNDAGSQLARTSCWPTSGATSCSEPSRLAAPRTGQVFWVKVQTT